MNVLTVTGVTRAFGGVVATNDVSLAVADGELRGVIGPNGAGKSTLFNLIAGRLSPDRGKITFLGRDVEGLALHRRAALGISIMYQNPAPLRGTTVLESVMVGAHRLSRRGFASAALRLPMQRHEEVDLRRRAQQVLARLDLASWADRRADSLSFGQQRLVQLGRALCAEPALLLLDEPASGLHQAERRRLADTLVQLHHEGLTMMLIEHDVDMVTRIADRITVLDLGSPIAEGTPDQIQRDDRVIAAYLGTEVQSA